MTKPYKVRIDRPDGSHAVGEGPTLSSALLGIGVRMGIDLSAEMEAVIASVSVLVKARERESASAMLRDECEEKVFRIEQKVSRLESLSASPSGGD